MLYRVVNAIQRNKRFPRYRFPWRGGNRFRLLVDGERFYGAMLACIETARAQVLLEMYLIESGRVAERFIEAFCGAARRGVRVCLLLDDYGARGLARAERKRLVDAGVALAFYNPRHYGRLRRNLFRDHRKLLLVDGRVAFTGGAGLTDAFDPALDPKRYWHELMVEIQGPNVADWQDVFERNWRHWGRVPLRLPRVGVGEAVGDQRGRVTVSRTARSEISRSFVRHIRYAKRRAWLASAYFAPSRKLRRALRRAGRRGVDVRLMLPGPYTDHPWARHVGRRYYARLLRNGVRIFEYQPRFLHTKALLCDDWVSIGSSNVDRWNLRWNLDANQEIDDAAMAEQLRAQFDADFPLCKEIVYERWRRRPRSRRLREWFWGRVAALLSWFSERRTDVL
jgi:phosphatidylserine/phosphatidylglycerophosphate/cardiolipin synthase-like enzyme